MEKTDMWLNLLSLALNFIIAFFGLTIFQDIAVVNYAIFISFLFFHISQDIILIQYGIHKQSDALWFYTSSALLLLGYHFLSLFFSSIYFFFLFWMIFALISFVYTKSFLREKATAA
jgi:hypothetical protein